MYSEEDLIPISALQHYAFCPRQWGLIHLEKIWQDNYLTAEGNIMHERTHSEEMENRPGIRTARSLRICSYQYGIVGQADVVEFHRLSVEQSVFSMHGSPSGIALNGVQGCWSVLPVEYKRGKPKKSNCDKIQLCAQALCLEEMLGTKITDGALYYGLPRRRHEVCIDESLRNVTISAINKLHVLMRKELTPPQRYSKKCDNCSLIGHCMPKVTGIKKDIRHYLMSAFDQKEIPQ